MNLLTLIPSAIGGAVRGMDWWARRNEINRRYRQMRRLKPYEQTEEGSYLKNLSTRGSISPEEDAAIMGRVGRESGNIAANASANYAARARRALGGNSIAAARGMNEIEGERMRTMGAAAENIGLENARTKARGAEMFAQGAQAYSDRKQAQKEALDAARSENTRYGQNALLTTITAGLSDFLTGKANKEQADKRQRAWEAALDTGDYKGLDPEDAYTAAKIRNMGQAAGKGSRGIMDVDIPPELYDMPADTFNVEFPAWAASKRLNEAQIEAIQRSVLARQLSRSRGR